MNVAIIITFVMQMLLVVLFLPLSPMDKIFNLLGRIAQAQETASGPLGILLILIGLTVEVPSHCALWQMFYLANSSNSCHILVNLISEPLECLAIDRKMFLDGGKA